jgi:glycosyltransferase involved in cell wall biosynthesis
MITYNHEPFVAQAIEGILMQKTDFETELIIGEDCSTDNTRAICLAYKEKYPDKITLLLPDKNLGMDKNFLEVLKASSGKYIAVCEGDDYWTDPLKLQKQADFMEANPEYAIVYHRVKILEQETGLLKDEYQNTLQEEQTYTILDLAKRNFIHTPSILFRRSSLEDEYFSRPDASMMDYYLWMLCAKNGKIKYLPEFMAAYRTWNGSGWECKPEPFKIKGMMKLVESLLNIFSDRQEVSFGLSYHYYRLLHALYKITGQERLLYKETMHYLNKDPKFQYSIFRFLSVTKEKKIRRFKYFFSLLANGSLDSVRLIKWCFV